MDESMGTEMGRAAQNRIDAERFGNFVAELRREKKLTQKEFADACALSGALSASASCCSL